LNHSTLMGPCRTSKFQEMCSSSHCFSLYTCTQTQPAARSAAGHCVCLFLLFAPVSPVCLQHTQQCTRQSRVQHSQVYPPPLSPNTPTSETPWPCHSRSRWGPGWSEHTSHRTAQANSSSKAAATAIQSVCETTLSGDAVAWCRSQLTTPSMLCPTLQALGSGCGRLNRLLGAHVICLSPGACSPQRE
jgi:hypothetical protein